jgi:hypothetical protein
LGVNFLDVEKTITNVTIKDAPYEVSDCYIATQVMKIATQLMKYGEVIPGSVRRGYIKGTNLLSDPGRYNYSIAFAMLVSVYMRRMGGWFVYSVSIELSDCYIATQMMKYGEVIPGSVRRGYIKGTNIENGSRYLQIINCAPTLPNRTDFS